MHVPKDERSKLDGKSRQCIFIGYGENKFGYRFYDPIEKKLVKSRDMKFMEDQTIEDIDKVEKSTPKEDNGVADFQPVQPPIQNLNTDVQNYVASNLEMRFLLMMMMKRSMACHKMKILVMLPNHLKFNSGGPTGRDNLLRGIFLMCM